MLQQRETTGSPAGSPPVLRPGRRLYRIERIAAVNTTRFFRLALPLCAALALLAPAATADPSNFTVLHNFASQEAGPQAGLVQGADGNFYGTTVGDTIYNTSWGTVFRISPQGQFATLYSFSSYARGSHNTDGAFPYAPLALGSDGSFYGAASRGGAYHVGTLFNITADGVFTKLHTFTGAASGGAAPLTGLVQGADGNFYGTTAGAGLYGDGTLFQMTPDGHVTSLHSFNGTDGADPQAALVDAGDGTFLGTTVRGGANNDGVIYRINPNPPYVMTVLHSFTGTDGAYPQAALVRGSNGDFYGTTSDGGNTSGPNVGTVFRMSATSPYTVTTLYVFNYANGHNPTAPLIQASDGNFYGTAPDNIIYQITPDGAFNVVHTLTSLEGRYYLNALVQGTDGLLYGTTGIGGQYGGGTVFRFKMVPVVYHPDIASISPTRQPAGAPPVTLTLTGTQFQPGDTVLYSGSPLTTYYISHTQLTATIPASQLVTGIYHIKVSDPNSGSVSGPQTFTVTTTRITPTFGTLTRDGNGVYHQPVSLQNTGYASAPNLQLTLATLGQAGTSDTLPLSFGTVTVGQTVSATLAFPASAGAPGSAAKLHMEGTYTGDTWSKAVTVTLP